MENRFSEKENSKMEEKKWQEESRESQTKKRQFSEDEETVWEEAEDWQEKSIRPKEKCLEQPISKRVSEDYERPTNQPGSSREVVSHNTDHFRTPESASARGNSENELNEEEFESILATIKFLPKEERDEWKEAFNRFLDLESEVEIVSDEESSSYESETNSEEEYSSWESETNSENEE